LALEKTSGGAVVGITLVIASAASGSPEPSVWAAAKLLQAPATAKPEAAAMMDRRVG
jgi:hypothetical protein